MTTRDDITLGSHVAGHLSDPQLATWRRALRREIDALATTHAERDRIEEELAQMLRDEAAFEGIDLEAEGAAESWLSDRREHLASLLEELRPELPGRSAHDAESSVPASDGSWFQRLFSGLRLDLLLAVRSFAKRPGLTAIIVATLVLGIGLNSTVFSVLDSVLFRPLAVADSDRLLRLYSSVPDGFLPEEPMAYPDLVDLHESPAIEGIAAHATTFAAFSQGEQAEIVIGEMVSDDAFELLGVRPLRGRLFTAGEDNGGIVLLSAGAWRQRFDGDPSALGSTVRVNGHPLEVAGVLPGNFRGLQRPLEPQFWITLETAERIGAFPSQNSGNTTAESILDDRNRRSFWGLARMKDGFGLEAVETDLENLAAGLASSYPETNEDRTLTALPFGSVTVLPAFDANVDTASGILLGLVLLVLLIASANLANLLLARALARRGEMATRLSLGASRARIVRQLMVESLLLAFVGAVGGLLVAGLCSRLLSQLRFNTAVPLQVSVDLDGRVLLFTVLLAGFAAVAFGLMPAVEASRTDLSSVLREHLGRGGKRLRFQSLMVATQVALSVVLLTFGGLALRSVLNATRVDTGLETANAAGAVLSPRSQGYEDDEIRTFYERLTSELAAHPSVASVSSASHLPLSLFINTLDGVPASRAGDDPESWPELDTANVDATYFETLGIELLRGRAFERQEIENRDRVAIVNQELARRFWPNEDPLGQEMLLDFIDQSYRVVGVAADGKYRTLGESQRPFIYLPLSLTSSQRTVAVRFARDVDPLLVTRKVRELDPHLAIASAGSLDEMLATSVLLPKLAAAVFGSFGLIGLLLSSMGLFGVLAYTVRQRTHEIGLRVALGAGTPAVLRLVLRRGLILVVLGIVAGTGISLAATRALESMLYGVSATDALTFVTVVVLLVAVAVLATLGPARRALRVSPTEALRYD